MNLPLFLARKMFTDDGGRQRVSRPAIRIATIGVAIGLAVMIVTVSVVIGFKHTIRDKVAGFGSHIQIINFMGIQSTDPYPVSISDSLVRQIQRMPGVKHVERYAMTQGILKTDSDFLGVAFKGVGEDYDLTFIRQHLVEGKVPVFSSTESKYQLLLSRMIADKLQLHAGQRVYAYFLTDDQVRARKFTVCGIYETNMTQFDQQLCFTDIRTTVRLNGWEPDQQSGAEVTVADFDQLEATASHVIRQVNRQTDRYGNIISSQTIHEAYPQIFSWLSLLDMNVWIIFVLMTCVAGFTMISGLLIIILERTQMIGILKALGARNGTIRHTFLWFASFMIGRGLIGGNVLGIGLVLLQQYTGFVRLDPQTYYVATAPVELHLGYILLLNIVTLTVSILVLLAPSLLVSHIHPARSMRYE